MRFLSIENKNLVINDSVFDYTDKIRIMHENSEICIIKKDDSKKIFYDAPKGYVLKLYLKINDDWLYYEKVIFNYETVRIDPNIVDGYLFERKELIQEIIGHGISI